MDFESASHGVSVQGMRNYITDLNLGVFMKVKNELGKTQDIFREVNAGWNGQAAENFKSNILAGVEKMRDSIDKISDMLETELMGIQSEIIDFDENLVDLES